MQLNPDCLRTVLLYIEENQEMNNNGYIKELKSWEIPKCIPEYQSADVIYSIKQLYEYNFINCRKMDTREFMCFIFDITPTGHEFLSNVKNDTVWNSTKENAKQIGSYSLGILSQIASAILTTVIKQKFGI